MMDDNESENNVFSELRPVVFDPTGETTDRTRSTSPNKKRAEMKFWNPRIVFLSFRSPDHPQDVTEFMMKFRSTMRSEAVIPEYFSALISAEADSFDTPADFNFGELPDSHLKIQRLWRDIQKVLKATEVLTEIGGYEGNWRDMVVNPLLKLATEHFGLEDWMIVSNVDMVRIDPDDLPPRDPMDENKGIQIKKIDTILTLKLPTTRVYKAFAKWPAASRSFIQSTMDPHCGTPIVVNIEVKAANGIDPLGQLGIWSAAGFQKRLIDKNEKKGIPCIPMSGLAIVGDRWELHIAYRHPDGRVILAGPMNVGSTRSYVGIFQIINCLRILTDWGLNEYNTWLEDVVWKRLERGPS